MKSQQKISGEFSNFFSRILRLFVQLPVSRALVWIYGEKSSANSGVSGLADVMAASRQWNDKWGLILTPFFIFSTLLISAILRITDCRQRTRRVDCLEKGRTRQKFLIIRSIPSPSLSALPTRQMTRGLFLLSIRVGWRIFFTRRCSRLTWINCD